MGQSIERLRQRATTGFVVCGRPPMMISVWLVALLGLGNPFACLFHCWYQPHVSASLVSVVQPVVVQSHHGAAHGSSHGQTAITDPAPTTANSSPVFSCSSIHETIPVLTIAVILSLLWVRVPFTPGIPLIQPHFSLRLVTFPPPYPPPRLALSL